MKRLLIGMLIASCAPGCASSGLLEGARRTERVQRFESARSDGTHLFLTYETSVERPAAERPARRRRSAVLLLADLDPALSLPVDAVPWKPIDPGEVPTGAREILHPIADPIPGEGSAATARVVGSSTRHAGLVLERVPGAPPGAEVRAATLLARSTAPWAFGLMPLALAWDLCFVPQLAVLGVALFIWDP